MTNKLRGDFESFSPPPRKILITLLHSKHTIVENNRNFLYKFFNHIYHHVKLPLPITNVTKYSAHAESYFYLNIKLEMNLKLRRAKWETT